MNRRFQTTGAARRARKGMTLVEVIVAMLILTGVILALGAFTARYAQASGQVHLVIAANEIAATRLDAVRTQPSYTAIDSLGKATPDMVPSGATKFARRTQVARVGGAVTDSVDYKIVTVTVTHPSMKTVVSKTTAVAAF
jgi:prepilin-type N-terminal cleavage/methylation domain-containing protein